MFHIFYNGKQNIATHFAKIYSSIFFILSETECFAPFSQKSYFKRIAFGNTCLRCAFSVFVNTFWIKSILKKCFYASWRFANKY